MKRASLLLTGLLLVGCAPATVEQRDPWAASVALRQSSGYQVVSFASGKADALNGVITLSGINLAVNDPSCQPKAAQLVCAVGRVPAGSIYTLPARGVLVVEASYQRADGRTYSLATDGQ